MTLPPRLSVIIPTVGRPLLTRTLMALLPDLAEQDEAIVVGDGLCGAAAAQVLALADGRVRYLHGPETHCFGNAQRQFGIAHARGTHLVFVDDDDLPLVGYAAVWRTLAARHPQHVILARMIDKNGLCLWWDRRVAVGNVSTQTVCVPNVPPLLGTWGERYEGDLDFIQSTLDVGRWPVAWSTTILVDCRPPREDA